MLFCHNQGLASNTLVQIYFMWTFYEDGTNIVNAVSEMLHRTKVTATVIDIGDVDLSWQSHVRMLYL